MIKTTWLASLLKDSRFLRAVLLLSSATAVGQLLVLLVMPLLTRLYTPTEFGVLAIFNALAATALAVSSLRYEFAIPLRKSDASGRAVLVMALAINAVFSLLLLLMAGIFRDDVAQLINAPNVAPVILFLPLVVLGGGTYKALNYWAVRKSDFKTLARTRIYQSASNVGMQLAGGLAGWSVYALVAGQFFGYAAGTLRLARGVEFGLIPFKAPRFRLRMLLLARLYVRFPKFDVPAAIVDVVSVQLPNILLAALFSTNIAGLYLLADRILNAPLNLVSQAIGQVLYAGGRDGAASGSLARSAARIAIGLGAAAVVPTIVLFFVGDDLFALIFGEAWREAGEFASWLILGLAVQFIYSSISLALLATEGQSLNLAIHLCLVIAKTAVLGYGYAIGSPLAAIIGFSTVNGIGYLGAIMLVLSHLKMHAARTRSNTD